jgi:hypothetical protein
MECSCCILVAVSNVSNGTEAALAEGCLCQERNLQVEAEVCMSLVASNWS